MARFLARRLALAVGILLVLSFAIYGLLDVALDPLSDLRENPAPNREEMIANRVRLLNLDLPWYQRYLMWLGDFVRGDFGLAWKTMQPVGSLVQSAVATSIQLIFAATIISILTGVTIGLISALRQYTSFDYVITFISFLLYSLPVFWVAVLLKQFFAIGVNDYIAAPTINWPAVIIASVVSGLFWSGALGGRRRKKLIVFGSAFGITLAALGGPAALGLGEQPADRHRGHRPRIGRGCPGRHRRCSRESTTGARSTPPSPLPSSAPSSGGRCSGCSSSSR
jgi:peptide/nickel transport system permease protein